MPTVLTQGAAPSEEKKSALSTIADWAGGLEITGDVVSLYGPASIVASPFAGVMGIIKDGARYFDDKQSGWTTLANISNHIAWGALGMIPEAKSLKLLGKANKARKTVKTAEQAARAKKSEELLQAWKTAEAELNASRKGVGRFLNSNKALEEKVNLARKAYEDFSGVSTLGTIHNFKGLPTVGRVTGKTATAGFLTYGVPGMELYVVENSDSSFTPGSIPSLIGRGAIGNGFTLLGEDLQNASEDWGAASRLTGTFLLPNARIISGKTKPTTIPTKKTTKSSSNKKSQKKQTTEQQKPKVDYAILPEIPGRKLGGKLNNLKNLRK